MKFLLLLFVSVCISAASIAQDSFTDKFKEVKLYLAQNKEEKAIPILEELIKKDKYNANLMYLLGYCYVKKENYIPRAIQLLEKASKSYSREYDPYSLSEKRVSEYVFYYLIIAYSLNAECEKSNKALNTFYKKYSFYDEWYLVEGQKWVRDCGKRKPKQEAIELPEDLLVLDEQADSVTQSLPLVLETHIPEKEIHIETPPADEKPESLKTEELKIAEPAVSFAIPPTDTMDKVPASTMTYRERLTPLNEDLKITTKSISYSVQHSLYGVQVAAFLEPKLTRKFENLKNIEVYVDRNGVYRYVIGRFSYYQQAEKLLEYVKSVGYKDAYIVDINQKSDRYKEEVVTVNDQSIKKQIIGKVDYRVQIGAYRYELPDNIARRYLLVDNIRENHYKDLTILTIGSFPNYAEAKAYSEKIKQIGFPDAFVVPFNYDYRISLEEAAEITRIEEPVEPAKGKKDKKSKKDKDF
jgi:hypothetical protein